MDFGADEAVCERSQNAAYQIATCVTAIEGVLCFVEWDDGGWVCVA